MIDVDNYNRTFPRYPKTIFDKGWVYGVWYCGTAWTKSIFYGQYPSTFLKRALSLFPHADMILQCPAGTVKGPGITVDLIRDEIRQPQIVADAGALPFKDDLFDLILSDPPYSEKDSKKYGCDKFPMNKFINEAYRVLKPGGYLGILHIYYPSYQRQYWKLIALIAVVTGFSKKTRMFSIFEKRSIDQMELFEEATA